ncbi:MAG: ABC transporter permease [Lachnospiraceae bacterium]|nr:ABC transporter permease [Lachnospiraceae bacterium]
MTTMNRMVEEKRTEVGTMKALGYSEADIMGKYLFYAGSAAIIGCVGGFFVGSKLFPYVIWNAYGIMYTMKDIVFIINKPLAIVSLLVAILCSMGATYVSLNKELKSNAADLIRPKPPKNGKRVIFERIKFLWKRLSFTAKVSVRNVFRYQKRLWMMVLGVGGCYGLLITGFGIKDSIADVCDCQFENIQKYDITVSFKEEVSLDDRDEFKEAIEGVGEYIYAETKTVDVAFNNQQKSATMVVFCEDEEGKSGKDYINFMDDNDKELPLPNKNECIINSKMAKMLGIKLGDEIILRDPDLNEIKVKVTGIMKNYVYNWAYISEDTFKEQRRMDPDYNTAFVKSFEDDYEVGAKLGNVDNIASVTLTDEMSVRIDNMMDSLNEVVLLVISCAAALAFIVMYNLTNINITERLREIATLKVLGFYPMETAVYVFRENLILTCFGIIAGLFMGYGLHRYVMYNINVEVVTFDTKILPMSYIYGVVLTIAFALLVDLVFFFKLERIKMAESLKSVE